MTRSPPPWLEHAVSTSTAWDLLFYYALMMLAASEPPGPQ